MTTSLHLLVEFAILAVLLWPHVQARRTRPQTHIPPASLPDAAPVSEADAAPPTVPPPARVLCTVTHIGQDQYHTHCARYQRLESSGRHIPEGSVVKTITHWVAPHDAPPVR